MVNLVTTNIPLMGSFPLFPVIFGYLQQMLHTATAGKNEPDPNELGYGCSNPYIGIYSGMTEPTQTNYKYQREKLYSFKITGGTASFTVHY